MCQSFCVLVLKIFLIITWVFLSSCQISVAQVDTLLSPLVLNQQKVFKSLEEALKKPNEVIVLELGDKKLTQLPEEIRKFTNLQKISLYENKLQSLPEWIGEFERLQWIDVYGNQLTDLPPELVNLKQLYYLDLGDNKLKNIPSVIFEMPSLKHLYLYGNSLKEIPTDITRLQKLTHLRLGRGFRFFFGGNRLHSLPDNFGELANLQELYLPDNALRQLPTSFGQLKRLSFLDLGHNRFRQIPPQIQTLDSLRFLHLWDRNFKPSEIENFKTTKPQTNLQLSQRYEGAFWAISADLHQGRYTVAELGLARAYRKDIFVMAMGVSAGYNLNGKMQSVQGSFLLNGVGFLSLGASAGYFWEDTRNNVGFRPEIGLGWSVWSLTYRHTILVRSGAEFIPKNMVALRLLVPISPSFSVFR